VKTCIADNAVTAPDGHSIRLQLPSKRLLYGLTTALACLLVLSTWCLSFVLRGRAGTPNESIFVSGRR
jgi:hypothetical protein